MSRVLPTKIGMNISEPNIAVLHKEVNTQSGSTIAEAHNF